MEPLDFVKALRRRWLIVVLSVVAAVTVGWITLPDNQSSLPAATSYTATATLLPVSGDPLAQTAGIFPDLTLFLTKGEVPQRVAEEVGYEGDPAVLGGSVAVFNDETTGAVDITLTGEDASVANTANTFATEIISFLDETYAEERELQQKRLENDVNIALESVDETERAAEAQPNDTLLQLQADAAQAAYSEVTTRYLTFLAQTSGAPKMEVLQEATAIPSTTTGFTAPKSWRGRMALSAALGLLVGVLLALATERFDTRLRSRQDVQDAYRLPVIAEIPKSSTLLSGNAGIAAMKNPVSPVAEAYRWLRSALSLLPSKPPAAGEWQTPHVTSADESEQTLPQVVLISSARAAEGKSTTAANLAVTMAETGKQVLLLDADFRNPRLSRLFAIPEGPGLADLLAAPGSADLANLARATQVGGVRLVSAGNAEDYHGTLPSRIRDLIGEARLLADVVIIDSAPLLSGNEAMDILPFADSVIMVSRLGRVTRDHAERAADLLARAKAPTLGVVLIGVSRPGALTFGNRGYGYASSSPGRRHRRRSEKRVRA